jgi:hypothetical protein
MNTDSRKRMLERVRAILSKTMDNGCTEAKQWPRWKRRSS